MPCPGSYAFLNDDDDDDDEFRFNEASTHENHLHQKSILTLVMKHISTKGSSGPEIAHLDYIDHYMLYCAMVAILAIRLPLAIPRI